MLLRSRKFSSLCPQLPHPTVVFSGCQAAGISLLWGYCLFLLWSSTKQNQNSIVLKNHCNCQTFQCYPYSESHTMAWGCRRNYMHPPLTLLGLWWQKVAVSMSMWGQLEVLRASDYFACHVSPSHSPIFLSQFQSVLLSNSLSIQTAHSFTCKSGNLASISGLNSSAIKMISSNCTSALLSWLPTRKSFPCSFKT